MDLPSDSARAAERFRPPSDSHFKQYAKDLAWLIEEPLQRAQEALARIYGYAGLHELQETLKKPGAAGPFDDDLPYTQRAERVQGRRGRVEGVLAAVRGLAANELPQRWRRVWQLGLFSTPKAQREMRAGVEQVLLAEARQARRLEGAWPKGLAKHLDRIYRLPWRVTDPAPGAFAEMLGEHGFAGSSFDPAMMVANARRYREAEVYLAGTKQPPAHPDLPDLGTEGIYDCDGAFMEFGDDDSDFAWNVVENLYPKYAGHIPADSDHDDATWEALAAFVNKPTKVVAAANPLLAAIPNVVQLAKAWDVHRYRTYAEAWLEYRVPYCLLTDAFRMRSGDDEAGPVFELFLELEGSGDHRDMDDMSIWSYRATCLLRDAAGDTAEPVALLAGSLIVPFKGNHRVHPENLMVMMDAQSAFLNDVWKVLQYQLFPRNGYADIRDFFDERPYQSFMTVEVEIAQAWRGKGLLDDLIEMLGVVVDANMVTGFDRSWAAIGMDPEDHYDTEIEGEEQLGSPAVFIFPVAGTEPKEHIVTPLDIALTYSRRPPVKRPRDPQVEARKDKLTKHFVSLDGAFNVPYMGEQIPAEVLVYDPWDFPMT